VSGWFSSSTTRAFFTGVLVVEVVVVMLVGVPLLDVEEDVELVEFSLVVVLVNIFGPEFA